MMFLSVLNTEIQTNEGHENDKILKFCREIERICCALMYKMAELGDKLRLNKVLTSKSVGISASFLKPIF